MPTFSYPDAQIPKEIRDAVEAAIASDGPEAKTQVRLAIAAVRRLPNFRTFREHLINYAIEEMVYEARHKRTRAIKNANGVYFDRSRPDVDRTHPVLEEVKGNFFDEYYVGGTSIGEVTFGEDLKAKKEMCFRSGDGWYEKGELLDWADGRGRDGRKIRSVIPVLEMVQELRRIRARVKARSDKDRDDRDRRRGA